MDAAMAVKMYVRDHKPAWHTNKKQKLLLLPDGSKLSSRMLAQTTRYSKGLLSEGI